MSENELILYLRDCVPTDIMDCYRLGDFDEMRRLCAVRSSSDNISGEIKSALKMILHLADVASDEFRCTRQDVLRDIRKEVPDFSEKDLSDIADSGYLHLRRINGETMFFSRAAASVLKGFSASFKSQTAPQQENPRDTAMALMKDRGVMKVRNRIRSSISLTEEAFTAGEELTVQLPLPRENDCQSDIVIESISPPGGVISSADSLTRAVCWRDEPARNTRYSVEYSYTCTQRFTDTLSPGSADAAWDWPGEYLGEQEPQIVFSPLVRMVTERVAGHIDGPMEKARAIFDYITLNMKYSYMPPYILMPDIVDECLRSMRGDCGVFALTMITMLRCAGIPARWQSGLAAGPLSVGCHDWLRFYTPSHGWLPADPSYGTGAVRDGSEERRRFYFGNLDPWRMIANDVFQGEFDVPKRFFSIDPYDNQLGEIENGERGFSAKEVIAEHELLSSGIL